MSEVNARILLWGIEGSGKTTTLETIHAKLREDLDAKLEMNRLQQDLSRANEIQMGMLPQEQALGARMMMGVFATPGDGDDTLVSKIEVNDQGHVLANGQRLQ